MMEYKSDKINEQLLLIFQKIHDVDFIGQASLQEVSLLDDRIGFKARDMVFLLYEIEKEFGILIPEEFIADGRFSTYLDIRNIIISTINS